MFPRTLRHAISPVLYHLYVKRRINRTESIQMFGLSLTILPTVFHPRLFFSSSLLCGLVRGLTLQGAQVLDMGTGSGVLALCAAQKGAEVLAADINPKAVECAMRNAAANGLQHRVTVVLSDLFDGIMPQKRFDYIFWNPPFYPRGAVTASDHAWYAGEGYGVLRRFAEQAGNHLRPGGSIFIILSSDVNIDLVLGFFPAFGLTTTLVQAHEKVFESFSIYRIAGARTP